MVGLNIYVALSSEGVLYALDGRMKKDPVERRANTSRMYFICGGLGGANFT